MQDLEALGQMFQEMNQALTQEINGRQGSSGAGPDNNGSGTGSNNGGQSNSSN